MAPVKQKFQPLPRGFGALPKDVSRAAQRSRLLDATVELVCEHGYGAVSIAAIVARAGVSKSTFYEHFAGKQEIYGDAWSHATRELFATIRSAAEPLDDPWRDLLHRGLAAYLDWWTERPEGFGSFLDAGAAGPEVLERSSAMRQAFTELFVYLSGRAREEDPRLPELGPVTLRALIEGIHGIVVEWIRTNRAEELRRLQPDLERFALVVIRGGAAGV